MQKHPRIPSICVMTVKRRAFFFRIARWQLFVVALVALVELIIAVVAYSHGVRSRATSSPHLCTTGHAPWVHLGLDLLNLMNW
jgi:hypothetical protein